MIVSILIPIYNRIKITQAGLESLKDALRSYQSKGEEKVTYQIVVIDDGSTDGSSEWISENHPEIIILKGDGNLWWSGAINLGAKYSVDSLKADFLLLWNDDIIPAEDYFLQMEKILSKKDLTNKIIGSKIFYYSIPKKILSSGGLFNPFTGKMTLNNNSISGNNNDFIECDWLSGMGTLVPAQILKKRMWWDDKKFPHYFGDTDFCLRCKKLGVKILLSQDLVIFNKTEHTGITQRKTFKDFYYGLTSLRSNYNINKSFLFYSRHGILPFAYFGWIKKYLYYLKTFLFQ